MVSSKTSVPSAAAKRGLSQYRSAQQLFSGVVMIIKGGWATKGQEMDAAKVMGFDVAAMVGAA